MDPAPTVCYRHPDRVTRLSCSECGRTICVECSQDAAVGQKCPECGGSRPADPGDHGPQLDPRRPEDHPAHPGADRHRRGGVPARLRSARLRHSRDPPPVRPGGRHLASSRSGGGASPPCSSTGAPCTSRSTCGRCGCSAPRWNAASARLPFGALYLAAGLNGAALFAGVNSGPAAAVGASGAIFGLFGALLLNAYRQRHTRAGRAIFSQLIMLLGINLMLPFMVPRHRLGGPRRRPDRRVRHRLCVGPPPQPRRPTCCMQRTIIALDGRRRRPGHPHPRLGRCRLRHPVAPAIASPSWPHT